MNRKTYIFAFVVGLFIFVFMKLFYTSEDKVDIYNVNVDVLNLSYAYGATVAINLKTMNLSPEEKNADFFVEGFKKGLEGDSAEIAIASQMIQQRIESKSPSSTPKQAVDLAYNLGILVFGSLTQRVEIPESDFDLIALKEGYISGTRGVSLKFTQDEMDSILNVYFVPLADEYLSEMEAKQKTSTILEEGIKFLKENKLRDGIVTTESGLQYEIILPGSGPKPIPEDLVKTHYHGTFTDGTVFNSSVNKGKPAIFGFNQVIPGWVEGLQLMSVGAKYRFFIPQYLAYGMIGEAPNIPGGSVLIFDLQLLEIIKK
jgi:FKBP-type peptidyl-prolyl cis-trans isomerase